jgi:hypothetical protein
MYRLAVRFNCDHCITTGHNLAVNDQNLYLPIIYIIVCLLGTDTVCLKRENVSRKDVLEVTCGVQKLFLLKSPLLRVCVYVVFFFDKVFEIN